MRRVIRDAGLQCLAAYGDVLWRSGDVLPDPQAATRGGQLASFGGHHEGNYQEIRMRERSSPANHANRHVTAAPWRARRQCAVSRRALATSLTPPHLGNFQLWKVPARLLADKRTRRTSAMNALQRIVRSPCGSMTATYTRRVSPPHCFSCDSTIGIHCAQMDAIPSRIVRMYAPAYDIQHGVRTALNDEQRRRGRFVRHQWGNSGSADHRSRYVCASPSNRTVRAPWYAIHRSGN